MSKLAQDLILGKTGLGMLLLALCPILFLGVSVRLFFGVYYYYGESAGMVSLLYGFLSFACLVYSIYLTYCLLFSVKAARIVEYTGEELIIIDYLGRRHAYPLQALVSCELTGLNRILRSFFLFLLDNRRQGRSQNWSLRFQDGRSFILSSRMQGLEDIVQCLNAEREVLFRK